MKSFALLLSALLGLCLLALAGHDGPVHLRVGPLELELALPSLPGLDEGSPATAPSRRTAPAPPEVARAAEGEEVCLPLGGGRLCLVRPPEQPQAPPGIPAAREPMAAGPEAFRCWPTPEEDPELRQYLELLLEPGAGETEGRPSLGRRLIELELGLDRLRRQLLLTTPSVS